MASCGVDFNQKSKRRESYQKNLILNASAPSPIDSPATVPSEFYSLFLSKTSQLKAKEVLSHRLLIDKVFKPESGVLLDTSIFFLQCQHFFLPGSQVSQCGRTRKGM